MEGQTRLVVVTKGDLRRGGYAQGWDDPDRTAPLTPQKTKALLENPLSSSDDDPAQIIGLRGDRVIGRLDVIPGRLYANGEPLPCLWASYLVVPEQFRNTLMGVSLVLKLQQLHPTVAVCGVSQVALPVYQKLRWQDYPLPRYMLLRRSRPVVEKLIGPGVVGRAAGAAVDFGLAFQRALMAVTRERGVTCEPSQTAPAELEERLSAARAPLVADRSAAWIEWAVGNAFDDQPQARKGLFLIRDRSRELVGALLLKLRFHETASHRGFRNVMLGSLADWMILRPDRLDLRPVILLAARELSRWGADAMEFCTNDEPTGRWMKRWGMRRVGELHLLVRAAPASPLAKVNIPPAQWQLRPADGDCLVS
jgi:hypothetical protein